MKALIIDDSHTFRQLMKRFVKPFDIKTEEASDGLNALVRLAEPDASDFDMLFVDWDMPNMNGIEFVKALRSCPEYSEIPVMMVTSHNKPDDLVEAIQVGANEFLMKPLNSDMVGDKLRILGLLD